MMQLYFNALSYKKIIFYFLLSILLPCTSSYAADIQLTLGHRSVTNRGVVASGPYRFVRHPAYSAKVILWIIQGIFFAQFTIGILFAFLIIYYLRAWTEERHLSLDPDYLDYKKKVKWRYIPGIV
jgi:protein-S-isoprenylcysteine O-methyltransferase Ste14